MSRHIHFLEKQLLEVHQITDYAAVIFPLRRTTKPVTDANGRHNLIMTFDRVGDPYIAFARVDIDKKNDKKLTTDGPAARAMTQGQAAEMGDSLARALNYLEAMRLDGQATLTPPSPQPSPSAS